MQATRVLRAGSDALINNARPHLVKVSCILTPTAASFRVLSPSVSPSPLVLWADKNFTTRRPSLCLSSFIVNHTGVEELHCT